MQAKVSWREGSHGRQIWGPLSPDFVSNIGAVIAVPWQTTGGLAEEWKDHPVGLIAEVCMKGDGLPCVKI
jgi:hypothetical protein